MADTKNTNFDRWPVNNLASDPARLAFAVTTNDAQDLVNPAGNAMPSYAKGLYIGVTGNVAVITCGDDSNNGAGTPVTFTNVPVGWFPVQVRRVMNTNTTASGIIALMD